MFRRLVAALERVGGVGAPLFTWEVSVPFDDEPGEARLREKFAREFPESSGRGRPCFWKMVAFNGDSGKKVRYLVAVAAAPVDGMRRRFDRVLPEGIALYGMADRIIRIGGAAHGKEHGGGLDHGGCSVHADCGGNALFSFLCGGRLVILVFCEGRLCHWSEEEGYEEGFDGRAYAERMERFRRFLARDEYLARGCPYSEFRERVDPTTMCGEFRRAARDPFWRGLDLDNVPRVRPLYRKIAVGCFLAVAALAGALVFLPNVAVAEGDGFGEDLGEGIALSVPSPLPTVTEVRETQPTPPTTMPPMQPSMRALSARCNAPPLRLRSVVQGVLFQGDVGGTLGWYRPGDSVGTFVVDSVGRDRVVLVCGGERMVFAHGE